MLGVQPLPKPIVYIVLPHLHVHSYSARSSTSEHFLTKQSALDVESKAFSCVSVKIWNGISTSLKNLSRNSFKETIRIKLNSNEILETENSFAEIDTLIN